MADSPRRRRPNASSATQRQQTALSNLARMQAHTPTIESADL